MLHINRSKTKFVPNKTMLVAAVLIGTCLFLWASNKLILRRKADRLPPGPRGLPIVGYLPFLGPNLHRLFMELSLHYGPIYKLSIGQKLCVMISSPSLAKEVVRDHDITLANRNPTVASKAFSYGGKDIAFSPCGPEWRILRKIFIQKMQSNSNLESFYPLRRNEVKKNVRDAYNKAGTASDVGELAFLAVINMISGMFWGGTLEGDDEIVGVVGAKFPQQFRNLSMY